MDTAAFNIRKGDTFTYRGETFTAAADATGEFSTYVKVEDYHGSPSEIYIPSGTQVVIL